MKLRRRRILIVGASSGLGRELAIQLARRDCSLVLFSRSIEKLHLDADFVKYAGSCSRLVAGNACDSQDIERLAEVICNDENTSDTQTADVNSPGTVKSCNGTLDGIIVMAGVSRPDFIENPDIDRAIDTLRTNLEAPMRILYRFMPMLIGREGTFVAACTSMAGDRGVPRAHAYSASKAGLDRFLESLRIDLFDRGVKVFTIVPGYVETPMSGQNRFPMPGMWPVGRAAEYVIRAMERETPIIRFPWYHSFSMRLLGLLPDFLYLRLMNAQRPLVRIVPREGDRFSWPSDC
ncbi:MAG: SDR family NAD(P)-dependent oxidoreductase [Candidatus Riflebacteria bacterium]|nr:SDR family NAD(P)-dependent oxidoreductase [Candidatus Riflebacteria bacterium]